MAIDPDKPLPQNGRVDPATLDVAAKPKRKRRARNRPKPGAELEDWAKAAKVRAYSRPHPPGIILEPAGYELEHWTSPHNDPDLWALQLADAFGTRSRAVISTFLTQLSALCGDTHWDAKAKQWRLDENEYSAALAIVNAAKPRNEMEAALAAQMVAIHLLTMKVTARAIRYEYDTRTASVAAKLARTFAMQMEALRATRRRTSTVKQSIEVRKETHQHVHYHRGEGETDGQPQATRARHSEELPALPSPDKGGEAVPLASRRRKASL